ncbi:hypothetical protein Csa_001935 [Cucumis sativus]|nr:hypothetical protein Csa_001935 [Cucumis sativus]
MSIPYTKFVLIVPLKKVGQFSISISSIRRTQSFTSRLTVLILDASFQAQAKNKQFVQLHSRRQPLPMAGTLLCNASSASAFLARTSSSKTSLSLPLKPLALRSFSPSSRTGFFRIYALTSNDIKVGTNIEVDGAPWRVLEFLHVKPGKGAAFVRTKIRNYVTGNTVEKTFRAGSSLEEANVYKEVKQFTYKDGSQFVFMDLNTYEEIRLNAADVGDRTKWLKEGMDCIVLFWNGKVIDFEVPITIQLTVVDVDPGLKGDTAQGGSKPATLETGAVVSVPLFINVGDSIVIDTRTGQYTSRA